MLFGRVPQAHVCSNNCDFYPAHVTQVGAHYLNISNLQRLGGRNCLKNGQKLTQIGTTDNSALKTMILHLRKP